MTWLIVGILFAGAFVFYFAFMFHPAGRDIWKENAELLGLNYERAKLLDHAGMSGTYKGLEVTVRGSGKLNDRRYKGYTMYEVTSPDIAAGLAISENGDLAKLVKLFGNPQDIEAGLPALDEAFVIQGHDPALARQVLRRDGLEGVLLELRYKTTHLKLEKGTLVVEFDEGHEGYAVSAYLTKLTNLMKVLAEEPPSWLDRASSADEDSSSVDELEEVEVGELSQTDWW